jgi:hypothetical protein
VYAAVAPVARADGSALAVVVALGVALGAAWAAADACTPMLNTEKVASKTDLRI